MNKLTEGQVVKVEGSADHHLEGTIGVIVDVGARVSELKVIESGWLGEGEYVEANNDSLHAVT